jgi:predicted RecB family nuclease
MTTITRELFDSNLKCSTKCFLQSKGITGERKSYSEWFHTREQIYFNKYIESAIREAAAHEYAAGPTITGCLKTAKWVFGIGCKICAQNLETIIQAIERVPSARQSHAVQMIPIRFTFANKLTRKDKLLLAFDSFVLSETLGRRVGIGKIIHGDKHAVLKVRTDTLHAQVRELVAQMALLLSSDSSPALALNQHCTECEFQANCMRKAIENDDLSLLPGVSEKERKKLNSKGISTVTHLSYTFRPRRKSKRSYRNGEKYQHSLKALAIRQRKIHVVGSSELRIEGTPVYLDVEGIPDRDFYYLIGVRVRVGHEIIQHSLWAETELDEKNIWSKFLEILSGINKPVIVHYGSFETTFLKQMSNRYGGPTQESAIAALKNTVNLLSFIYARIYFPTYSNGLKDIAKYLGFSWTDASAAGIQTIIWRKDWEESCEDSLKKKLMLYNAEDCEALNHVTEFIIRISAPKIESISSQAPDVVDADALPRDGLRKFRKNQFSLSTMEEINRTAYWDYQHERIILRSNNQLRKIAEAAVKRTEAKIKVNKVIHWTPPRACPRCGRTKLYTHKKCSKILLDVQFGKSGIKKWVTKYVFSRYRCPSCGPPIFSNLDPAWSRVKYGPNLVTLSIYLNIDLRMSESKSAAFLNQFFGFNIPGVIIHRFKEKAAMAYKATYENILRKIVTGKLIHCDETRVSLGRKVGYVWAFASMENVAYVYAPSREGNLVQSMLTDFKGVLITDFYAAYESLDCPQQKCLIHLIRDLNDDLMREPYNEEIKTLISDFANLLKSIIATVDRFGLKTRFLRKHKIDVDRFFRNLAHREYQTEVAVKLKKRFEKNRNKLFTFLDYDNVPWNNNNAEHAIKTIAFLRRDLGAVSTERGIVDYLTLFSVRETCKFKGVNFLEFLRSGENDIDSYVSSTISYKSLDQ